MIRSSLIVIFALAVPVHAGVMARPMAAAGKIVKDARVFAQESQDRALAALYQRLFQLQDLRRDSELGSDKAELTIGDHAKRYQKLDRFVDKELLKEIAADPTHRRYPGITEKTKLDIVARVAALLRTQEISALEIEKIDRDISNVEAMIREHLKTRGR